MTFIAIDGTIAVAVVAGNPPSLRVLVMVSVICRAPVPSAGGHRWGPRRLPVGVLSASTVRSVGDLAPGSLPGVPGARGAVCGPGAARGWRGASVCRVLAGPLSPGGFFHIAVIPPRLLATPLPVAPRSPRHRWAVPPRRSGRPEPPALHRAPCHAHPSS